MFFQPTPNCGCVGSGGHSESYRAKVGLVIDPITNFTELLKVFSVCGHQVNLCVEGLTIIRDHVCDRPSIGRPRGVNMMLSIVRKPLAFFPIRPHHIDVIEFPRAWSRMQSVARREKTTGCDHSRNRQSAVQAPARPRLSRKSHCPHLSPIRMRSVPHPVTMPASKLRFQAPHDSLRPHPSRRYAISYRGR